MKKHKPIEKKARIRLMRNLIPLSLSIINMLEIQLYGNSILFLENNLKKELSGK